MKIVIFGLSVSSSWGNGHATLWRGLCKALARRNHTVVFFEKDTPYYREHRDLDQLSGCHLRIYEDWESVCSSACRELRDADAGIVTSYCPDALAAAEELNGSNCLRVFYDLDTPVTLLTLENAGRVPYIGPRGLADFDLVFSYTGGEALNRIASRLGARNVVPLYGSVDPECHAPVETAKSIDLSYLGTYAADRQRALDLLFLQPARRRPEYLFAMGGAQYPNEFPWTSNIAFRRHVPPAHHAMFYCSSRLTLNITRASMAAMGYCPSGRLFEAAACGVPIVTDCWAGLEDFFEPGREILRADGPEDVIEAMGLPAGELATIARNARARALDEHTADHRARDMEQALEHFAPGRVEPLRAIN
jgi:spore maturation protein CgeB